MRACVRACARRSRLTPLVDAGATAAVGATQITLKEAPSWRVGDEIVIASTDFDMNQAEVRKITAISGASITLDRPLVYMHWGVLQSYKGGTRTLDERAEVGLLTRNILVQGDEVPTAPSLVLFFLFRPRAERRRGALQATATANRHGAHIIITGSAQGRIDGIEVRHATASSSTVVVTPTRHRPPSLPRR